MITYTKLSMVIHKQAIIESFGIIKEAIERLEKKLTIFKEKNDKENITLCNEAIIRLKEKWKHEEDEQKIMQIITIEEYEKKYPDKVKRMKDMFGDFIKELV
jgi:hypothetical protein